MNTVSESATRSYSVADVGKVIDCFAADLDGLGQSTGLRTRENTKAVAADVKRMAAKGYLAEVNIYLTDADGRTIRAAKYEVTTSGEGLSASRPGNYLWPRTPGGHLKVHVRYTRAYWSLTDAKKAAFKASLGLTWGTWDLDTSFPELRAQHDRNYVSNGYGLQKSVYS